jgi:glycosyltransferase involved in cell wall biosynthesis
VAIERFIQSYAALDGAKLYIVGPFGSDPRLDEGDIAYYERCLALIPQRYRQAVVFTGQIDPGALGEIYRDSLGFFSFSEAEGMPNALLEAMAANCVPLVGPMGGVAKEIIPDRSCGFVLSAEAPSPDLEALRELSAAGSVQQRVRRNYGFDPLVERYSAIYRDLIRRRRASRRER